MASLGKSVKKSFEKRTISSTLFGILVSTMTTVAPMLLVMGGIIALYLLLDYKSVVYSERVLYLQPAIYLYIQPNVYGTL